VTTRPLVIRRCRLRATSPNEKRWVDHHRRPTGPRHRPTLSPSLDLDTAVRMWNAEV
jgi:hypothetical protein